SPSHRLTVSPSHRLTLALSGRPPLPKYGQNTVHSPLLPNTDPTTLDLLRLTLTPGFGPVLIGRAIALLGSAEAVLRAPESQLRAIKGVGEERAAALRTGREAGRRAADEELALAD